MTNIESALWCAINQHPNKPLVIAYSGGVDSQVLLYALFSLIQKQQISSPVTVCHVNHGLSENAVSWQNFAKRECSKLNLNLKICHVIIDLKSQQSIEALARDARYQALQKTYTTPSLIITGHHSEDQAETFLLALKRGSGLKGLSAMALETVKSKDIILRPFLNISRKEIINYATRLELSWIEDESNSDTRFDRNFFRNDIIPLLTQRWPSISKTINRASEHCRESQLLLDELALTDLEDCDHDIRSLFVKPLLSLSKSRFNNLIRFFLTRNQCLMPSTEQLIQLYQQLNSDNQKNPMVKVGDHYLRRYNGVIYLTSELKNVCDWQKSITLTKQDNTVLLPDNLGKLMISSSSVFDEKIEINKIAMPKSHQKISVRFSHNNPTCLPDYRHHSRSLKKILQELNIPTWQRKRIPFLYYDEVLVSAIGYFVCQPFVPKLQNCLKVNWLR